jgi:ABC-type phosphate/phosphonate transport system substrate-binding protein
VLCESDLFPQNVIAYSPKTLPAATAARLREAMVTAHTVPAGKPLMMFWGIARFDVAPGDYAEHLTASTKRYPAPEPASVKQPSGRGN